MCGEGDRYSLSYESSRTMGCAKGSSCARGVYVIGAKDGVLLYNPLEICTGCDMTVVLSLSGLYPLESCHVQKVVV